MLTRLAITNLALIQSLDLHFDGGFTVLTGETGAGKSLLLDALGLSLGDRADGGLIRNGATSCDVTAEFTVPCTPELHALLEEQGLETDCTPGQPTHLVLRRQLRKSAEDAKSVSGKAWVGGTPVSAGVLAALATHLLDLHGQHATHQLFKAAHQRDLVDELAGLLPQRHAVAKAYTHWHGLNHQRQATAARLAQLETSGETTAAWLAELDALDYQAGEEDELTEQRHRAGQNRQLVSALETADDAINADRGALSALRHAAKALQNAAQASSTTSTAASTAQAAESDADARDAHINQLCEKTFEILEQLEDVSHHLSRQHQSLTGDTLDIERIDDRLHALRAAARKHRVDIPALSEVHTRLAAEVQELGGLADTLARLEREEQAAHHTLAAASQTLTAARQQAFPALESTLTEALRALHLPHAKLVIHMAVEGQGTGPLFTTTKPGLSAHGAEQVELLFTANPGQPPQPLGRVASGGELSRAMLALKSVLFQALPSRTVVLDEVDTGLSGPTAAAIGQAMAKLAERHQVLAITHHPQVAAAAHQHFFIRKQLVNIPSAGTDHTAIIPQSGVKDTTITMVEPLDYQHRQEELARLLAGAAITSEARAAAASLLNENKHINTARAA